MAGAELATKPEAWPPAPGRRTRVDEPMLAGVEAVLADLEESRITMPREFIVAGETRASAALEVARTILRRAERRVITLQREGLVPGPWLAPYLNRLADLVWVLARFAESLEAAEARLAVEGGRGVARAEPRGVVPPSARGGLRPSLDCVARPAERWVQRTGT